MAPLLDNGDLSGLLQGPFPAPPETWGVVRRILARRRDFGISRMGSVTGLDRIGIPVVQVVRPDSRSVVVNQGKGLTYSHAAISGLMEALEGWASERIAEERIWTADIAAMTGDDIWSHLLTEDALSDSSKPMRWIQGWDMLSGRSRAVPLALVDTDYIIPSPHPRWLERNTAGLAAGTSLQQAMLHACLEILERDARCKAMATPHFFDRFQIDGKAVRSGLAGDIIARLIAADFTVGAWTIPSSHGLPIYWCHVMESTRHAPLAPSPADGFGCDLTHDRALASALLEACQSRLGVISAAREDVTGHFYQRSDRSELQAWREILLRTSLPYADVQSIPITENPLNTALDAIRHEGAKAAIAVVLFSDKSIPLHVVRVVAPPLLSNPEWDLER